MGSHARKGSSHASTVEVETCFSTTCTRAVFRRCRFVFRPSSHVHACRGLVQAATSLSALRSDRCSTSWGFASPPHPRVIRNVHPSLLHVHPTISCHVPSGLRHGHVASPPPCPTMRHVSRPPPPIDTSTQLPSNPPPPSIEIFDLRPSRSSTAGIQDRSRATGAVESGRWRGRCGMPRITRHVSEFGCEGRGWRTCLLLLERKRKVEVRE